MADATTTSATTSTGSGNSLSVSLPTDFLTGSGNNGLNLNFNFGGNGTAIANSAYNFLNTSFGNTQSFVNNSIAGTQSFLSSHVAPIVGVAANLGATFNNLMPGMVGSLYQASINANTVSEQISANATAAQEAASQASIAESQKASGGGGLCFITTAICGTFGEADDCHTLTVFRAFRDGYMQATPDRKQMVDDYYACAPGYVEAINARADSRDIYGLMARAFLAPAQLCIENGRDREALAFYSALVEFARVMAHEH